MHANILGSTERSAPRVLLVDDDASLVSLLAHALDRRGISTSVAHSAEEALERCVAFRPQIALLDLGLPTLDGHELGVRLRSSLAGDVALVALTGFDEPWSRRRSQELGFAAHLIKPVSLPALRRLIAELARPH